MLNNYFLEPLFIILAFHLIITHFIIEPLSPIGPTKTSSARSKTGGPVVDLQVSVCVPELNTFLPSNFPAPKDTERITRSDYIDL